MDIMRNLNMKRAVISVINSLISFIISFVFIGCFEKLK